MVSVKTFRQIKSKSLAAKSDKPQHKHSFLASGRDNSLIQELDNHIAHLEIIIDEQEINDRNLKAFNREMPTVRDLAIAIVEAVWKPLLVLDRHLDVVTANIAFYRMFEVVPTEVEGRSFDTLGNGQWQQIRRLRSGLEDILHHNTYFQDFAIKQTFERIGLKTMLLDARQIADFGNSRSILVEIADRQQIVAPPRQSSIAARVISTYPKIENPIKDLLLSRLSNRFSHPSCLLVSWSEIISSIRLTANQTQLDDDRSAINTLVDGKLDFDTAANDLISVIEAAIATATLAATVENIQIQTQRDPFSPQIMGDSTRLQQVLRQLLSNAVKSTQLDRNGSSIVTLGNITQSGVSYQDRSNFIYSN